MPEMRNFMAGGFLESINKLDQWCRQRQFYGWDLYDGLHNGFFDRVKFGYPRLHVYIVQFMKHCPVNLRPVLGIKKGFDNKGLGLFLWAYSTLYRLYGKPEYKESADFIFQKLVSNSIKAIYGNHCWNSHYYRAVTFDGEFATDIPDTIGSSAVIYGMARYYEVTKNEKIKEIFKSYYQFVKKWLIDRRGDSVYFLYTPKMRQKIVPNASAEAIESLYHAFKAQPDEELRGICEEVLETILKLQKPDGSWDYATYHDGRVRKQLDFHQGYMVDGLLAGRHIVKSENLKKQIEEATIRGARFYRTMFHPDGRAFYRNEKKGPAEIHNQSQGIITFAKLYREFKNKDDLDFSLSVARWTVENMQDNEGYFYYTKGRFFANKIPYMRWNEAWMMVALSTLLETMNLATSSPASP